MQSASIAARTANSAKVRANNVNIALMAISHQQFVSLQSENPFSRWSPPLVNCQNRLGGIRDAHHLLELFGVAAPIEQAVPDAIAATEGEKIDARETFAFLF